VASTARVAVRNPKLALDAVKAGIRARGDKLSLYSHAHLVAQANAMIGPWLVAQAKRQIAERTGHSPYYYYAIGRLSGGAEVSSKIVQLRQAKKYRNATSRSKATSKKPSKAAGAGGVAAAVWL
jgi:hypothetical protein